jgi:hypothetical protein
MEAINVNYNGKNALLFAFPVCSLFMPSVKRWFDIRRQDLSVRIEGEFILRYRLFDIYSRTDGVGDEAPIQAACFGGSFRIYSTKEFPGLPASTELTQVSGKPNPALFPRYAHRLVTEASLTIRCAR